MILIRHGMNTEWVIGTQKIVWVIVEILEKQNSISLNDHRFISCKPGSYVPTSPISKFVVLNTVCISSAAEGINPNTKCQLESLPRILVPVRSNSSLSTGDYCWSDQARKDQNNKEGPLVNVDQADVGDPGINYEMSKQ